MVIWAGLTKSTLALLLCFHTTALFAQTFLSAESSTSEVELGKPFTLTLKTTNPSPPLDSIDLSKLQTLFHIDTPYDVNIEHNRQIWKVRLSAYFTGKNTIPALHFHGGSSETINLSVRNAVDPKSGKPLMVNYSVSTSTPWVRQQVLVTYQLTSSTRLYDINLTSPENTDILIQELILEESVMENNNSDIYQYRTGFALFNLKSGQRHLELPPLIVKRDGTTTHRFYPAPIEMSVTPLPTYLPATVPVGNVSLKTGPAVQYSFTNTLSNILLNVEGKQIQLSQLPDIADQLANTAAIQTYPETRSEQQNNNTNGIISQATYNIPIKTNSQGMHNFREIRILYFDPETGTLQASRYKLPYIISVDKWLVITLLSLLLFIVIYLLHRLFQYLRFQIKRYRYYKLALRQLEIADHKQHIRIAMTLIGQAENRQTNVSPQQWLELFSTKPSQPSLPKQLNCIFYNNSESYDIHSIAMELKDIIKSRHALIL